MGEHKGHQISDNQIEPHMKIDPIAKKKSTLQNKIEASIGETEMFEEDVQEIEEQLNQEQENTLS